MKIKFSRCEAQSAEAICAFHNFEIAVIWPHDPCHPRYPCSISRSYQV